MKNNDDKNVNKKEVKKDVKKDVRKEKSSFLSKPVVKPEKTRKKRNVETNIISFIFIGVFFVMIIYSIFFTSSEAESIAESPYNPRNATDRAPDVRRGTIYANDGTVLAATEVDEDGKEVRKYPEANLFSLVVGMSRGVGSGVEGGANTELTTSTSKQEVEKTEGQTSTEYYGDSVYTTLDPELQKAAYDALGDYHGAVVAVDTQTGKVLAMVSKPDFDPNEAGTKYNEWASISDENSVLINRASQGLYAPGSTFKIVTALEYVKEHPDDYKDYSYICEGTTSVPGGTQVICYHRNVHGQEDLNKAFINSCNCAFSDIGLKLDMERFRATVESLGMNEALPIEIESSKTRFDLDSSSSISEIQETSFGQGNLYMTPLQMAMITATIANDGIMMKPYLIDKVVSSTGEIVKQNAPTVYKNGIADESEIAVVQSFMRNMVSQGAASVFGSAGYSVAGKTGTAQFSNDSELAHLWFTCYAPANNPRIAVTCIVERSEISTVVPERICKAVLDAYLD